MIFIRRGGRPASRFLIVRITIMFLAAGVWVAGVLVDDDRITAAAIAVIVLGLLLGLLARRSEPYERFAEEEYGDDPDDEG